MADLRPSTIYTIDMLDEGKRPSRPLTMSDIEYLWMKARDEVNRTRTEDPDLFNEGYYCGLEAALNLIRKHSEWARDERIKEELQQAREREEP